MGIFYFGQGYALGSLVLLLPLYIFFELGAPSRTYSATLSAIIIFPWYIKFVFGILSDYFPLKFGRRKSYLVIATLFSIIGWTTIGLHNNSGVLFVLSGISLALGSAMADSVIDGQAVEITPSTHIGRLQGVAWGARGLGLGSAGLISSQIVDILGWMTMFGVTAFFGIMISVIVLILPQLDIEIEIEGNKVRYIVNSIGNILTRSRSIMRFTFFLFTGFVLSIVPLLTFIMEREFNYSISTIGYGAVAFALGSFIGAIGIGFISDAKDTLKRFSILSTGFALQIIVGLFFINLSNFILEIGFVFVIGIFGGAYEAYQLRVITDETTPKLEGTMFSIWTGVSNLGQFLFGGVVLLSIAENLNISILLTLVLIIPILILAVLVLSRFRFQSISEE